LREFFRTAEGPRSRTVCKITDLPSESLNIVQEELSEKDARQPQAQSEFLTTINFNQRVSGDVPTAGAIIDRFLHHAQVVPITGKSYSPGSSNL
jgi:hypothetical protein